MANFNRTITEFEQAYQDLLGWMDTLPQELQAQANASDRWSPHEVLAQVAGWLVEAKRRFKRFPSGTGDAVYNRDAFNQVFIWQRAEQPWPDSIAEVRRLVLELADVGRALPAVQIERNGRRYLAWYEQLTTDATEHLEALQAWAAAHRAG